MLIACSDGDDDDDDMASLYYDIDRCLTLYVHRYKAIVVRFLCSFVIECA